MYRGRAEAGHLRTRSRIIRPRRLGWLHPHAVGRFFGLAHLLFSSMIR